jgi:hypothetical protein
MQCLEITQKTPRKATFRRKFIWIVYNKNFSKSLHHAINFLSFSRKCEFDQISSKKINYGNVPMGTLMRHLILGY